MRDTAYSEVSSSFVLKNRLEILHAVIKTLRADPASCIWTQRLEEVGMVRLELRNTLLKQDLALSILTSIV